MNNKNKDKLIKDSLKVVANSIIIIGKIIADNMFEELMDRNYCKYSEQLKKGFD